MGSETCIRDRADDDALALKLRVAHVEGGGQVDDERIDLTGLQGGCLLYTSDAADDLLCVDLGGRRIINKKNTTYNNRQQ